MARRPPDRGTSRRTLLLSGRATAVRLASTYVISVASLPFILDEVGIVSYGLWATVSAVLAIAGIADLGVRTEIVRRIAQAHADGNIEGVRDEVRRGTTVVAALAVAIGSLVLALGLPYLPALLRNEPQSLDEARVLLLGVAALLVVNLVSGAYFSPLTALQRTDYANWGLLVGTIAGVTGTVISASQGLGVYSLLLGAVVQTAITAAAQVRGMRSLLPPMGGVIRLRHLRGTRALVGVSSLVVLTQVSEVIDNQLDKLYLARLVGAAATAEYQIGTSLVVQVRAFALIPLSLMLVAVAELHSDAQRLRRAYSALAPGAVAVGLLMMSAIALLAPAFYGLLLGDDFARTGTASRLYAAAVALGLVGAPWALFAIGRGMAHLAAISAVANAVVNGVASLVLTMAIGFNGPLIGSIAGSAAGLGVLYALIRKRADLPWWSGVVRTLISLAVLLAVFSVLLSNLGALSWLQLVVVAAAYTLAGLALLHLVGAADVPFLLRSLRDQRR